jgi:hypothetical protein
VSAAALSEICRVAPRLEALELSTGLAPDTAARLPPGLTRLAIGRAGRNGATLLSRAAPGLRVLTVWEAPLWAAGSVEALVRGHTALEEVAFEAYDVIRPHGHVGLQRDYIEQDLACLGGLPRLRRLALLDPLLLAGAREEAPARLAAWARGWAAAPLEELRLFTSHDGDPHGVRLERPGVPRGLA